MSSPALPDGCSAVAVINLCWDVVGGAGGLNQDEVDKISNNEEENGIQKHSADVHLG